MPLTASLLCVLRLTAVMISHCSEVGFACLPDIFFDFFLATLRSQAVSPHLKLREGEATGLFKVTELLRGKIRLV